MPSNSGPPAALRPIDTAPTTDRPTTDRPPAGRPPGVLAVALAVVIGAWVTVDVLVDGPLRHLDHWVSDLVRSTGLRAAEWPQRLFLGKLAVYAITQLGARTPMVVLTCSVVALLAWRRRTWRPVFRLAVLLALLGLSVYAAKQAIGRSMPATDGLHTATGHTFPSGHVPTAVVLWGLLAWLAVDYGLPRRLTWALGVLRWLAPALTFAAMVLLDYHWLTDVIAGLALGVVLLRVLHWIDRRTLGDWRGGEHRRVDSPVDSDVGAHRVPATADDAGRADLPTTGPVLARPVGPGPPGPAG